MTKEKILSRSVRMMFSGGMMMGLGLLSMQAMADESQVKKDEQVQRVEITGSAIKRIDAETAVPLTIIKAEEFKKAGLTTIEQVLSQISMVQASLGTSQVVGSSTGGASFANLRGIGQNKTLVLLNNRRIANNAFDGSAPDLNMIPFAALERVEVLRDGASALYGSDAIGGVINFITKKSFTGFVGTIGFDSPKDIGGKSNSQNIGYGIGNLATDGYNIFGIVDHQQQDKLRGSDRPFNKRYAGGLSPTTNPANYYQGGDSGNPTAPSCAAGTFLIPGASGTSCQMTTSSFVDYIPKSERTTALLKGTLKLNDDHELGVEYMYSQNNVSSQIAPVPYGGLYMNQYRPDGSLNPYYPGNPGAIVPNIPLDPNYTEGFMPAGVKAGFIHVKWRDLPNGPRSDSNTNKQQRFVTSMVGNLSGWDYDVAASYNENNIQENLKGYSNGNIIKAGMRDGVINPFGDQSAAGTALINSAALDGNIQNARGITKSIDGHAQRDLGDWLHAGKTAAVAIGAQLGREEFIQAANPDYAAKVVNSTGIDPNTLNQGKRNVSALYAELYVPLMSNLEVTASARYDKASDFGNSTNPKVSFQFRPIKQVLLRGAYSTGFRAPSLYEINASQAYTNTSQQDDPINCPNGKPIAGKASAANCQQQFQSLTGGNLNLKPETSKNYNLGLVVEPITNVTTSVDLWHIQLDHTIGTLSDNDVFDPAQFNLFSNVYHRNSSGDLATDGSQCPGSTCGYVDLRTQNLGSTITNGVDLSATYKLKTSDVGVYNFGLTSTYVHEYKYQNFAGDKWHPNVGVFAGGGAVFRWQHNVSLSWNMGAFGAGLAGHYKSGYLDFRPTTWDASRPTNYVAAYTTYDAYGSWAVGKNFTVTGGVRNLLNKEPPLSYQTKVFQAGYDPRYSDPFGRTYYVRAGFNF